MQGSRSTRLGSTVIAGSVHDVDRPRKSGFRCKGIIPSRGKDKGPDTGYRGILRGHGLGVAFGIAVVDSYITGPFHSYRDKDIVIYCGSRIGAPFRYDRKYLPG